MILTLSGTSVGHTKNMQDMTNAIARAGWKDVVVGSVQSFDHLQILNEQKMAEAGWVKQEQIGFRMALGLTYARILRWISGKLKRKSKQEPMRYAPGGGAYVPDKVAREMTEAALKELK
jgi:hypothetical protein